jgi:hypothetical protein
MRKLMPKILMLTVTVLIAISTIIMALPSQAKDGVVMVYASWSVISRDLRPIAATTSQAFGFPYEEYDVDDAGTADSLKNYNIAHPNITPYIAIVRNGNVVFSRSYENSTPELLKQDLASALGNFK